MTAKNPVRAQLLAHLELQDAAGGFSDEAFARLQALVTEIRAESPVPAPMLALDRVEGRWETVFAHFGARHSAGKTRVHDSDLKVQSFNRFPAAPVKVTRICQEIARAGCAYNNVIDFLTPNGAARGVMVVRGVFRGDDANPQRFVVDFVRVELHPVAGTSELQLREGLGFTAVEPLLVDLKPPRLHSDVVYLDDDMRINIGSFGGLYLLRRSPEPPFSI